MGDRRRAVVVLAVAELLLDDEDESSSDTDDDGGELELMLAGGIRGALELMQRHGPLPGSTRRPHRPRIRYDVMQNTDVWFRENLRMSRRAFQVLCDRLRGFIRREPTLEGNGGSPSIGVELQVAVALTRLANARFTFRMLAQFGTMGDMTAHAIVMRVCRAINRVVYPEVVVFEPDFERIAAGFHRPLEGNWQRLVGCLDGTHIPINAPTHDAPAFFNRKGFYSLNVQAVADANLLFRHVAVGAPGSVHDTRVLRLSPLPEIMQRASRGDLERDFFLLADEGYPNLPWLLTPFTNDDAGADQVRRAFNVRHKTTRQVVERAFGLLKGKWRALQVAQETDVGTARCMVWACFALHNWCLLHDGVDDVFFEEPHDDAVDNDEDEAIQTEEQQRQRGALMRNYIANRLFFGGGNAR